ncbi:MAG: threonylcarbamoyl-AMP synthase [Desulfurococcales archaeon]|nr:threonylcarbamoyl-AMP synthase [Desulfurococcales archaeon]
MEMKAKAVETDYSCPSIDVINTAVEIIKKGGLVVIPTETVYGIAGDAFNKDAVYRVYQVKERALDRPIPLLLGESHHALKLVEVNELFWRLAARHWPGPLTIVAKPSPEAPDHLKQWGSIGVRLPDCEICRAIARRVGGVITGTSANLSGSPPPKTAVEAMSMLGGSVELYIDSGPAIFGVPSTVVDITSGKPVIIREGAIKASDLL